MGYADYIGWTTGLILPWLTGLLLVRLISARLTSAFDHPLTQIGTGYFVGWAVCVGLLRLAYLLETPPFGFVVGGLAAIAIAALVRTPKPTAVAAATPPRDWRQQVLLGVVVLLLLAHLAPVAVEAFLRPTFPWDAWTTWVYRAKVWFLAGGLVPVVDPATWSQAGDEQPLYTIAASGYPILVSLVHLWAAVSLGHWSESLVNVPTFLAGLAMGMALYGQLRDSGMAAGIAAVTTYLFFSVPILGSHMALGGYADLWLAGYAGLGFVFLGRWRVTQRPLSLLWGALFLVMACLIKNEGLVWAMLALVFVLLGRGPRGVLLLSGLLLILGLAGWFWSGGLENLLVWESDHLLVKFPALGTWAIVPRDVTGAFLTNFFELGSWHLLWPLMILALVHAAVPPVRIEQRAFIHLVILLTIMNSALFFLTAAGRWAEDFTAINRISLHLLPAMLYLAALSLTASNANASIRLPSD